jgi:hypothetical protein
VSNGGQQSTKLHLMSDPVLSDELLGGLVERLGQLKGMSSDPAKVQQSIDEVNLTLKLRT